jgi:predicted DNA-binding protein (UPF0251 family)
MGTVKRDLERKGRQYEESYPYEAAGIAALLRDVYRLSESRLYDGDIDATAILIDLKMALDSNCLTPRMRQVVALYYFAQFTEEEAAEVLGISQVTLNESLETAIERISSHMEYGYTKVTNAKANAILLDTHEIKRWLNVVACGGKLYEIDDETISGINIWRASKLNDRKDLEAIKQRIEGYSYEPVYESEEQKYPALTWEQIRWRDRRMSYVSEVKYDDRLVKVGFKNTAIINEEDEWVYPRQRLFAKRN